MRFTAIWIGVLSIFLVQFTTRTTAITIPKCYGDISGIYLRKYLDNGELSLLFFFPLGGVLQFNAEEKVNTSNYFTDATGFYTCKKVRKSHDKIISFRGLFFGESGNKSVIQTQSSVRCHGAIDDCSDNLVTCSNGTVSRREYAFQAPDETTGEFTNPISPKSTRQFQSRRLFSHPKVSLTTATDRCYADMSGIYITQYPDGGYDVKGLLPLGYFVSVVSGARNADGTFNRGTSMGTWYCRDTHTISGLSNYFSYPANTATSGQSIISSTFYMQCPPKSTNLSQYENCAGQQSESYFPLQYQRMPFRDGRPLSASSPTFTASRLFRQPTIKSCHERYAGQYAVTFNLTSPSKIVDQDAYILYRNGFFYVACSGESSKDVPCSNLLGVWDCNDMDGNLFINRTYFKYPTSDSAAALLYYSSTKLACAKNRCQGAFSVAGFPLQLPVNGAYSGTPSITILGSLTLRKLPQQN